jgi:hypothetical protein
MEAATWVRTLVHVHTYPDVRAYAYICAHMCVGMCAYAWVCVGMCAYVPAYARVCAPGRAKPTPPGGSATRIILCDVAALALTGVN